MERTKRNITTEHKDRVSFILSADLHLQETQPVCRTDDFESTQFKKLDWLKELSKKYNVPVISAGDVFDYWKPSPELLSKIMEHLPEKFWAIYGQHDLPQHNFELSHKSGLHCLSKAKKIEIIPGGHWGFPFEISWQGEVAPGIERKMCVAHITTYQGTVPFPGCTAPRAGALLRKYPEYDIIVTGDNHKPFVEYYEGRVLVNPGSFFRLTAAQADHQPRVYLYYAESNTVEPVYVPIEKDVISQEHLDQKKDRDNRIEAFISTLNSDWEVEMSFEENIEKFRQKNNVRQSVMEIIYKAIENEKD